MRGLRGSPPQQFELGKGITSVPLAVRQSAVVQWLLNLVPNSNEGALSAVMT